MSFSADPKSVVDFECESVTGSKTRMLVRFLTSAERSRLSKIINDRIDGHSPSDPGVMDAAREAIELGIQSHTFEQLADLLTDRELCLLACRYRYALDLSEIDQGKFTSRLPSRAAKSAELAAAAVATSQTNELR